jgi:REP element-mobilizing transposase RayT
VPQSFAALPLHIVFSTKGREPTLPLELIPRLRAYMSNMLRELGCPLLNANGVPDHVHLLASLIHEPGEGVSFLQERPGLPRLIRISRGKPGRS